VLWLRGQSARRQRRPILVSQECARAKQSRVERERERARELGLGRKRGGGLSNVFLMRRQAEAHGTSAALYFVKLLDVAAIGAQYSLSYERESWAALHVSIFRTIFRIIDGQTMGGVRGSSQVWRPDSGTND
jgi:hypothetical protein